MEFRKATINDVDAFVENRMQFIVSVREVANPEQFRQLTREYVQQHIEQDDLIIYIATDGGKIVASCLACVYTTMPVPVCYSGKTAEILNVNTLAEYRKQGIAEKLLTMLIDELKSVGVGRVFLQYTDAGLHLYEKLGFTIQGRQMQMNM